MSGAKTTAAILVGAGTANKVVAGGDWWTTGIMVGFGLILVAAERWGVRSDG